MIRTRRTFVEEIDLIRRKWITVINTTSVGLVPQNNEYPWSQMMIVFCSKCKRTSSNFCENCRVGCGGGQ